MAAMPDKPPPTVAAIYAAYEANAESGYRYHLGASLIGTECERSLWYSFRWATRATFEGRMLRLFETGQLEEARFVANLRAIGVEVYDTDPENPEKQIGVRDDFGHFGGSLDGMGIGVPEAPKAWHVLEFKTHSEKSFEKLRKEGVQKSKPRHYAQMQVYMHLTGVDRALYLARNKNTDALYSERVHYDVEYAVRLIAKANRVIQSNTPPGKISNDPSWWECKFCDHYAVCHGTAKPERHCRSCLHSTPVHGGEWACAAAAFHGADVALPREVQEEGCDAHRYIPDLIHGEQIDAVGPEPSPVIVYRMRDGSIWEDRGVNVVAKCKHCNGSGGFMDPEPYTCPVCNGTRIDTSEGASV